MAFCIVVGSHEFTRPLEGYPGGEYFCRNCGNRAATVQKSWTWFTVCFVPVIPFSTGWHREVVCYICRARDNLKDRPDITAAPGGPEGQAQFSQQGVMSPGMSPGMGPGMGPGMSPGMSPGYGGGAAKPYTHQNEFGRV